MAGSANENQIVDHLFRHESGRMVAALTKLFGFDRLEIAEDLIQDTFIQAVESWKVKGTPDNPQGWLYRVAKNKATDYVRRQQTKRKIDEQLKTAIPVDYSITAHLEQAFQSIDDSQLQMLFAVCHPSVPKEARIALALKTLGGFSIQEIANAFLTNKETINKRLYRAKEKIRKERIELEFPHESRLKDRLESVLETIYLLFNEGYYSRSNESVLRKDLCLEAMRLALLLLQSEITSQTDTDLNALMALMCFHASRFESRIGEGGEMIPWSQQDQTKWNAELINRGTYYLRLTNPDNFNSRYQVEAGIAYYHTHPESKEKWEGLLSLYNRLARLTSNPMVLLNQAYVISKVKTPYDAIDFIDSIDMIKGHYLYYALRGELLMEINKVEARNDLQKAHELAPLKAEKKVLKSKIEKIDKSGSKHH